MRPSFVSWKTETSSGFVAEFKGTIIYKTLKDSLHHFTEYVRVNKKGKQNP